jgi:tetratricopeptide (TPR) repeat protein
VPVASPSAPEKSTGREPESLLPLALSRPSEALAQADRLLAGRPTAADASIAHQARGIVLRDRGDTAAGIAELRAAVRLAQSSGDPARVADARATLGLTLGIAGQVTEGLDQLGRAADGSTGVLAGQTRVRRAALLITLGQHDDALADLRRAVPLLRRAGDAVWEARSRMYRFAIYATLGRVADADRELVLADRLFVAAGQELEAVMMVQNRAYLAYLVGDLAGALGFLDEAESRYGALDVYIPELAEDRSRALLAAGLAGEAMKVAAVALRDHTERGGRTTMTAELHFAAAQAALAAGQATRAGEWAGSAHDLFRQQGRHGWQLRADHLTVQSRYALGERGARLAALAGRLADQLDALSAAEAPAAHLLAGRLAADHSGLSTDADRHLARAARSRHRGPTFGQPAGWLAQALRAQQRGNTRGMLIACRRGLDAAGEHLRALAAPELRAYAAGYGVELAGLAQRLAVQRGDARMLLLWSERWRASALSVQPARPPEDPDLARDLAALREVTRQVEAAIGEDSPTGHLLARQRALEAEIRSRTRRTRTATAARAAAASPGDLDTGHGEIESLIDRLDGHRLVELTTVDGQLYATTVVGRRVRMYPVGPAEVATRELALTRFQLRRLAHGRPPPDALRALAAAGAALQRAMLGEAVRDLGDGPVVVVPTATLHAVPWGLLPALRAVPTSVTPSAATWRRAGNALVPRRRRVVLVVGPGLSGTDAEVARVADGYPGALVLRDGEAKAEPTLRALDGAWLAHIAAHGVFRSENPLFSAITLDDGPLTGYDLARLRRAPLRLVLSSCDSVVAGQVGDELLGMVSALVPLGTASLLASVVPVNDAASTVLMAEFHAAHRAGHSFSEALCEVRRGVDRESRRGGGDPVLAAAALSFVALGR